MKKLLELYCTFFRIGGLTFGGGMAMLPMLKREIVEKYGWATEEELLDIYAIGQCTPGVIAVNTSTYIGYQQGKLVGSIFATLGMISPSPVSYTHLDVYKRQVLAAVPIPQSTSFNTTGNAYFRKSIVSTFSVFLK